MPVNSIRLGNGSLTVGSTPLDISCQVVGCILTNETETGDKITVLCGDQLDSGLTTTSALSGTIILDPYAGGIGEFSWANHGTSVPFVFTPNIDTGLIVTGTVLITRLDIGSDTYGNVIQPEFEWQATVADDGVTWPTAPVTLAAKAKAAV